MKVVKINGGEMIVDDDFQYERSIGMNNYGYATCYINRRTTLVHRMIMGAKEGETIDHINGNKLDNRRSNLRVANKSQNGVNRVKPPRLAYYFRNNGKWKAQVKFDGKSLHLGYFDTKEEAHEVAKKKHAELHGEYSPYF